MTRGRSLTESALLLVLAFMLLAASLVMVGPAIAKVIETDRSHAEARHGAGAIAAQKCFDDPSTIKYTLIVRSSKKINVCQQGEDFFFRVLLQVRGSGIKAVWSEITMYKKAAIKSVGDLIQYAEKCSYTLLMQ